MSFPARLPHPAALPWLYPALCYLPCLSRGCEQGQAVGEDLLLPRDARKPTEPSYPETGRAVPGFAGIALVPAKTRLKSSCLSYDDWE